MDYFKPYLSVFTVIHVSIHYSIQTFNVFNNKNINYKDNIVVRTQVSIFFLYI